MDPSLAINEPPSKDPYLPPMVRVGDILAPKAPMDISSARLEDGSLTELALKLAVTTNRFTTEWVSKRLQLAVALAAEVLEQLCREGFVEETRMGSQSTPQYRVTQRGREQALRAMEVCAYIGPRRRTLAVRPSMCCCVRWRRPAAATPSP